MNMSGMTLKILHQDAIKATVDYWPRSPKLIAYKHLNALGCKLDGIDYEIDKEIKKGLGAGEDRFETSLKQHSLHVVAHK